MEVINQDDDTQPPFEGAVAHTELSQPMDVSMDGASAGGDKEVAGFKTPMGPVGDRGKSGSLASARGKSGSRSRSRSVSRGRSRSVSRPTESSSSSQASAAK